MQEILFDYRLNPTTWAYISALMLIGTYFKFRRFWSMRNLDLAGLIAFSPGLLLVYYGLLKQTPDWCRSGYVWLFAVGAFFLIRLLLDPVMVRRPLLEPNLSASGLTFTGIALLVFLMANVITSMANMTTNPPERLERLLARRETPVNASPGCDFFYTFAGFSHQVIAEVDEKHPEVYRQTFIRVTASRGVVIFAHLAILLGMIWIGFRHFDNIHTGVAAATLYLLTFYTSQFTSQVDHVVPAMLLVWAVAAYRRPLISGMLLGLAGGLTYYPLFLLPLWVGFYWRRGLIRFTIGVLVVLTILVGVLALTSPSLGVFLPRLGQMFGWRNPLHAPRFGFWEYYAPPYRIPVLAAFVAMCGGLALWPAKRTSAPC